MIDNLRNKLQCRSRRAMFVGFSPDSEAYLLMDLKPLVVYTAAYARVEFHTQTFPGQEIDWDQVVLQLADEEYADASPDEVDEDMEDESAMLSTSDADGASAVPEGSDNDDDDESESSSDDENGNDDGSPSADVSRSRSGRRLERQRRAPRRYSPSEHDGMAMVNQGTMTFRQAKNDIHWPEYKEAMIQFLKKMESWNADEIVSIPNEANLIGSWWVMYPKINAYGELIEL